MNSVFVDLSKQTGARIKPMHSVNNGPVYKFAKDQRITNIDTYRAAGIPFARNHDASFCATYGGEHIVDVNFIFRDFDADPTDPASYDFTLTDEYLRVIEFAGTKNYYRLGSKIEHWQKKYNTLPPKDFRKWAVVCEHIIRHYTEGWADGFRMDIEYWEIWNEPDLDPDDSTHKRCWGGTKAQFFDLFEITAKHLKSCFPHLKIGGPAIAGNMEWGRDFLFEMKRRGTPLDFFSWHIYAATVEKIRDRIRLARSIMDEAGYPDAESILNEWNYVRGWTDDVWIYSLKCEKSLKGAAFISATMLMSQNEPLDHLMYYDARPCGMNGLFSTDNVTQCLKGYYPFYFFNKLYRLRESLAVETEGSELWAQAATDGNGNAAVLLTRYSDDDGAPAEELTLSLAGLGEGTVRVTYYLLDETHDGSEIWQETVSASDVRVKLPLPSLTTYFVSIERI